MEFKVLGPLEVSDGGRSVPLGGAKQRALLAILLTQANAAVGADRLIDLIWSDEPPDTAAHSLQVYVSQLRKILEPEHRAGTAYKVLVSQPPGYLLRIEPESLDLNRFQRFVDEGRAAMSAGAHELASSTFREALGLWRGAPLADLALQPFVVTETARLEEARLRATEDRIDADLASSKHADLVGELESHVRQHPLRESFSRQLMLALYRSGRQAEASAVFQEVRGRLVDELGMEPGHDLQRLLRQVLNQDPALDLAPIAPAYAPTRTNNLPLELTSFVGRIEEVEEVTRLLAQSRLVTITGAGGVGKTRLAIRVAEHLGGNYRDGTWLVELAPISAEVCERLDGIPLAIELAAAKLRVLSLAQVAQRLNDRFRLLTGGSRTALPRQQTLRAAIDWSYGLLSAPQQATLRRLSVFAGGISLEAAEAVCPDEGGELMDLVDLMSDLVAKSLLVVDRTGLDARYEMLETIRQYASERLLEAGEAESVRNRHRGWFQALAEQAEPHLRGANQADWHDRLKTEHDNLRGALGWAFASGDTESALRLAGTMGYFWRFSGHRAEALGWLERALELPGGSTDARARVLYWVATCSGDLNDYARAQSLALESLAMFREVGDRWAEARVEQVLGSIASR